MVTVEEARGRIPTPREAPQLVEVQVRSQLKTSPLTLTLSPEDGGRRDKKSRLQLGTGTDPVAMDAAPDRNPKDGKLTRGELLAYFKRLGLSPFSVQFQPRHVGGSPSGANGGAQVVRDRLFE